MGVRIFRVLVNQKQLRILKWLKRPRAHFPPQAKGDQGGDGVCGPYIACNLQVSQPPASVNLRLLVGRGLLTVETIRHRPFCLRNERGLRMPKPMIAKNLGPAGRAGAAPVLKRRSRQRPAGWPPSCSFP